MNSQIKILLLLVITFTAIFFYARSPIGITFAQQLLRKADLNVFLPQEEWFCLPHNSDENGPEGYLCFGFV